MNTARISRNFYILGIFFFALLLSRGLFENFIAFQVQGQAYKLSSVSDWFVVGTIIWLLGSLILLKYYFHKQYWVTFSAGLLNLIASLPFLFLVYNIMVFQGPRDYNIPFYFLSLSGALLHAISLIFSRAGQRRWLKAAGILMFIQGLFFTSTMIGSMYIEDVQLYGILGKIRQWTSLAGPLFQLMFILNFWSELKALQPASKPSTLQRSLNGFLALTGINALVLMLIFGQRIRQETHAITKKDYSLALNVNRAAKPYEARTFVGKNGDKLPYRLLKPLDYDPAKKYPLVVHLHGGDGCGTDNVKQIYYGVFSTLLSDYRNRRNYPAFIFVPQCPPNATWGGAPYNPDVDELVFEAMGALEEEFNIDEKRRYVMGASLGGYGTWHFISARPQMFAAAVPVCGGGDPQLAPNAVGVPVWAFHGKLDKLVPVRDSREMIAALKEAGGDPHYTEFPDKGHDLWETLNETPGLMEWVFSQERK